MVRFTTKAALAALMVVGLSQAAFSQRLLDEIVARVGNDIILKSEYDKERNALRDSLTQQGMQGAQLEQAFQTRSKDILRDLIDTSLLVQLPAFAYALVYHHEIVAVLFGGKFIEHSSLLPVIMGFATLSVISVPVSLVAQYEEKAGAILLSKIFVLYNVGTMLVFAPLWGIYGAALSTGSADVLKNLFIWWLVRGRARWTNAIAAMLTPLVIWGVFVGICLGLKNLLHVPALAQLILGAVLCLATGYLHLRSPALSSSDREILGSLLRGRQARLLRWLGLPTSPAARS